MKLPFPIAGALALALTLAPSPARAQQEGAAGKPAAPPAAEATNAPVLPAVPAVADPSVQVRIPDPPEAPEVRVHIRRHHGGTEPVLFSNYFLAKEKTNYSDAVVIKGSSSVDGVVQGDLVTIFGNAKVNGKIQGDMVVVMGSAELGPEAEVGGQLVVVGGHVDRADGAKVGGESVNVNLEGIPGFHGAMAWFTKGFLMGRPLPLGVGWAWMIAGFFLLINLLILLMFPRPIQACVDAVERQPIGSFFVGILVKVLIAPIFLLLVMTGVGIIIIPFLVAAMIVAFLFGKVTMYRYVGSQLGRQSRIAFLQAPAIALIVGTAIFYLLYTVPIVGFLAWGLISVFGLGAVVMAAVQKFRGEKEKTPPPAMPSSPSPVPPIAPIPPMPMSMSSEASSGSFASNPSGLTLPTFPSAAESQSTSSVPPAIPTPSIPRLVPPVASLEESLWPRAGFWVRFLATLLDWIMFSLLFFGGGNLLLPHAILNHLEPGRLVVPVWIAYHVGMWTWKGTTIGGIILGLKVVRVDGQPLEFGVALIRSLAALLSFGAMCLGFFWAGWSREKQSWHDKIAGTIIVKAPKGLSLL